MSRLGLLLLILLAVPARAQPARAPSFDANLAGSVYTAGLGFIAPRALDPVTVSMLTLWGLHGLTALDPDLAVEHTTGTVRLRVGGHLLAELPLPANESPSAWAGVATQLGTAAWAASPTLRHHGTEAMIAAFFDELLDHLDPYSRYLAPVQAASDEEERAGEAGIGVTLARRGRTIVVAHAVADGPAALGGIREGDRILAVDGTTTRGVGATDVDAWLAGSEGTPVTLDVQTPHGRQHLTLTRADVPEENVFARRDGGVLVVRISGFTAHTATRLATALQAANAERRLPDGIVLDLRGNRGGLLREAVGSADVLLPAGLVAVTAGRDPAANRVWRSTDGELDPGMPVVVLVDGYTASAAEIVSAALADRGRGVVVGSSTLGKGAGADDYPPARGSRAGAELEPGARRARLADPGPRRAAAGLHQSRGGRARAPVRRTRCRHAADGRRPCPRARPARAGFPNRDARGPRRLSGGGRRPARPAHCRAPDRPPRRLRRRTAPPHGSRHGQRQPVGCYSAANCFGSAPTRPAPSPMARARRKS